MELRHLRYFIGIVENEGYREASRVLHVAQPALSQTVIDLEEEIGTPLLAIVLRSALPIRHERRPEGTLVVSPKAGEFCITTPMKRSGYSSINR